jgi:hypothetical protein
MLDQLFVYKCYNLFTFKYAKTHINNRVKQYLLFINIFIYLGKNLIIIIFCNQLFTNNYFENNVHFKGNLGALNR